MNKRFWRKVLKEFKADTDSCFICIGSPTFKAKWSNGGFKNNNFEEFRCFCFKKARKYFPKVPLGPTKDQYTVLFDVTDRQIRLDFLDKMIEISE
jgi:hypothetical protein